MKFGSILDDEPAFQFRSMFKYNRVPGSEEEYDFSLNNGQEKKSGSLEVVVRACLIVITYSIFVITFPLSAWFCLKKVKSLERCVIFRLGERLPLKGPGYVVTFPCLDVVDVIDLNPQEVQIAGNTHVLTSDGSVIEIKDFPVTIAVSDAVKSFTQLRDSKSSVEQFIKLGFSNLLASTHVEDLERKIDWIIKDFILNCNQYMNKWGWEITGHAVPKFNVISRAEPSNPLVDALKAYFCPQDRNDATEDIDLTENGSQLPARRASIGSNISGQSADRFIDSMQSVAGRFSAIRMLGRESVIMQVNILSEGSSSFYKFTTSTGKIDNITFDSEELSPRSDVQIQAKTSDDLLRFIQTNDNSLVEISHSLF